MEKDKIFNKLETRGKEYRLAELFDRRSKRAEYLAEIQRQGEELAEGYRTCMARFKTIFEIVGTSQDRYRNVRTNPIVLTVTEDEDLGMGKIVARLRVHPDHEDAMDSVDTFVSFVPDTDESRREALGSEHFRTAGHTFGGGTSFLMPDYVWFQKSSERADERLLAARAELMPTIYDANQTQAVLWEAITNPDLNSTYAERALALQRA